MKRCARVRKPPGVSLSLEQKLRTAERIEATGLKETEVGYPGAVDEHYRFTQALKRAGVGLRTSAHVRAYLSGTRWKEEVDRAIEAGSDIINLLLHSSRSHLRAYPWLRQEELPERTASCVEYAKRRGKDTAFGLADTVMTDPTVVASCYDAAREAGVNRLYIYDGQGCATPEAMAYLTRLAADICGGEAQIAVHCHNDLGLALANSLAAVQEGATVVDAVVNGLGDRAGNAALEELVVALTVLYGIHTGVDLEKLSSLSEFVSEVYGVPLARTKPLVGANAYRHQTDSHILGLLTGQWWTYEVIRAEALGRTRSLEFGPATLHSGYGAIMAKIQSMGLEATANKVQTVLAALRRALKTDAFLTEREMERLILASIGDEC